MNMKRIRSEQIQATTLRYLKKRNFTDSESTFHHNFKFVSSPIESASELISKNLISNLDAIAMVTHNLDEYFTSFKTFKIFVYSAVQNDKCVGLKKLLWPVFVHSYLDLINADRKKEAEEFYNLYCDIKHLGASKEMLEQLQRIKEEADLYSSDNMSNFRSKICEVYLSNEEKALLLRFLQGQDNLMIMKIINERFCFYDSNGDCEEIVIEDVKRSDNDDTDVKQNLFKELNPIIQDSFSKDVSDNIPMLISPPTSYPSVTTPSTTQLQTAEKVACNIVVDESLIVKHVDCLRKLQPAIQGALLFNLDDSDENVTNANMSNNKHLICSCQENSAITLWNINHLPQNQSSFIDDSHTIQSNCTQSFPNISFVTFGNEFVDEVLSKSWKLQRKQKQQLQDNRVTTLLGHCGPVYSSAFTHDDKFLLSCSEDTSIRLWDLNLLNNRTIYYGHNYPVLSVTISALSFYFASGSMDHSARLWSFDRTYPIRIFAGHEHSVENVAFHTNASYLASADHTIRLWDINSGKTVRLFIGHWAPITCLIISPDGKLLASSGEDCRVRIWDIGTGNLLKEIRFHNDTVYSLSFSGDSSMLSSCGADSSLCLWNVSSALDSDLMNKNVQEHTIAHWNLNDNIKKLLFTRFSGDILNSIGVS